MRLMPVQRVFKKRNLILGRESLSLKCALIMLPPNTPGKTCLLCPPNFYISSNSPYSIPRFQHGFNRVWHNPVSPNQTKYEWPQIMYKRTMQQQMINRFPIRSTKTRPICQKETPPPQVVCHQNFAQRNLPNIKRNSRRAKRLSHTLPRKQGSILNACLQHPIVAPRCKSFFG